MSNITVITLNKFGKPARGLLRTRISSTIKKVFDWFRSPNPNKTPILTLINEYWKRIRN